MQRRVASGNANVAKVQGGRMDRFAFGGWLPIRNMGGRIGNAFGFAALSGIVYRQIFKQKRDGFCAGVIVAA